MSKVPGESCLARYRRSVAEPSPFSGGTDFIGLTPLRRERTLNTLSLDNLTRLRPSSYDEREPYGSSDQVKALGSSEATPWTQTWIRCNSATPQRSPGAEPSQIHGGGSLRAVESTWHHLINLRRSRVQIHDLVALQFYDLAPSGSTMLKHHPMFWPRTMIQWAQSRLIYNRTEPRILDGTLDVHPIASLSPSIRRVFPLRRSSATKWSLTWGETRVQRNRLEPGDSVPVELQGQPVSRGPALGPGRQRRRSTTCETSQWPCFGFFRGSKAQPFFGSMMVQCRDWRNLDTPGPWAYGAAKSTSRETCDMGKGLDLATSSGPFSYADVLLREGSLPRRWTWSTLASTKSQSDAPSKICAAAKSQGVALGNRDSGPLQFYDVSMPRSNPGAQPSHTTNRLRSQVSPEPSRMKSLKTRRSDKDYYYIPVLKSINALTPLHFIDKLFIHTPIWLGSQGITSQTVTLQYKGHQETLALTDQLGSVRTTGSCPGRTDFVLSMPLELRLMESGNISIIFSFLSWFEDPYGHRYNFYFLTSFGRVIFNNTFRV